MGQPPQIIKLLKEEILPQCTTPSLKFLLNFFHGEHKNENVRRLGPPTFNNLPDYTKSKTAGSFILSKGLQESTSRAWIVSVPAKKHQTKVLLERRCSIAKLQHSCQPDDLASTANTKVAKNTELKEIAPQRKKLRKKGQSTQAAPPKADSIPQAHHELEKDRNVERKKRLDRNVKDSKNREPLMEIKPQTFYRRTRPRKPISSENVQSRLLNLK